MTTEQVVERAEKVGGSRAVFDGNRTWRVRCPVSERHPRGDRNPSLDITKGDNGTTLVKSWSQHCEFKDIAKALGLKQGDFFERHRNGKAKRAKPAPEKAAEPEQEEKYRPASMTLVDLAQTKGFDGEWLGKTFGLKPCGAGFTPGKPGVLISYFRGKGHRPWVKTRAHLSGRGRFYWQKGTHLDVPYNRFGPDGTDTLLRANALGRC